MTRPRGLAPLILPFVLAAALVSPSRGEEPPPPDAAAAARLLVQTTPGATIEWNAGSAVQPAGEPSRIELPSGVFEIEIRRSGYLARSVSGRLNPGESRSLVAPLSPKSHGGAVLRAALIPGWGSRYMERRATAWTLFGAAVVSGAAALYYDGQLSDRSDEYDARYDEYLSAVTPDEIASSYDAAQSAFESADDAKSARDISLGVLAGVYVLSVAEAVFLFPFGHDAIDEAGASARAIHAPRLAIGSEAGAGAQRSDAIRLTLLRFPRRPASP